MNRGEAGDRPARAFVPTRWSAGAVAGAGTIVAVLVWRTVDFSTSALSVNTLVLVLGLAVTTLLSCILWLARKNWEQASTQGMARMQRAIERATDGVWEWDVLRRQLHRSEAVLRHLGYDPAQVNGPQERWTALVHEHDAARVADAVAAHLAGRTDALEIEYRVRAADGSWHTIVDRGRVIERTEDNRASRLLGISGDVTDRARADAALEAGGRRFRAIFDSAYHLQLLLDLDGRILEANHAAEELADVPSGALRGQLLWEALWWDTKSATAQQVRDAFARAVAGAGVGAGASDITTDGTSGVVNPEAATSRFEATLASDRSDRRTVIIDFTVKPILDGEGRVMQVLAEGRDLTDRKRAEVSLREIGALTTMGQIAARVAHEINNPLAGIQNAFLLVRGAIPTDHPHYHFVGAIDREIGRIASVTRQLYETYRPDQSMASESSVILAISDAVAFLGQVNRTRTVRITTDVSKAPSLVPVPDALIRQTLYNLVQNAVDASPDGGIVEVTAVHEGYECIITVCDEGSGIPEEIRQRIFEPFFSTKDRTLKTGGMGIGLALVRQSVLAVGGRITVRDRPGRGTEFEIRLPMTPIDTGALR
ncbi:MAG: ATP-binding protein [Gemmatimonadota bacterium]